MATSHRRGPYYPPIYQPNRSAYTIGAKRDQYGNLIRTSPVPAGKMSAEHDWSSFDKAFPAVKMGAPATPPAPPVINNTSGVKATGDALSSAYSIPGAGAAAAVMDAVSKTPQTVAAPASTGPSQATLQPTAESVLARHPNIQSVAGAPPMTNFMPGDAGTKSLADHRQVVMKPIPAPTVMADGTKTNVPSVAANMDFYKPGGATESAYAQTQRQTAPPPDPAILAAAGTGQNVAANAGDVARSTFVTPPAPAAPIAKGIPGIPFTQTPSGMPTAKDAMPAPAAPTVTPPAPVAAPQPPAPVVAKTASPLPDDELRRQRMQSAYAMTRGGSM